MIGALLFAVVGLAALGLAGLALFTAHVARRVEATLPPRGRFVEVDGARIHYLDEGAGPAILMIHGLGGQMGHFTHSLFERLTGEFRVVVMERPGSGYSRRARGASAKLSAQAETVAGFITALRLERPLLVGHSLGGAVALAVALDHPEQVGGLALIAPLTHVQEAVPAVFRGLVVRSPALRWLIAWTLATPAGILRSEAVLAAVFGPEAAPRDFATRGGGLLTLRPGSFITASEDLVAVNHDLAGMVERYRALAAPVSILYGADDRLLSPAAHGEPMTAMAAGVEIEIVAGGHMLPVTQPELTAAWVRRVARRRQPSR